MSTVGNGARTVSNGARMLADREEQPMLQEMHMQPAQGVQQACGDVLNRQEVQRKGEVAESLHYSSPQSGSCGHILQDPRTSH
jgi:hypothetical protein